MRRGLRLEDSLEVILDHRGKTPKKLGSDFVAQGVPVASAIMVKNGTVDLSSARHVSQETYERWMPIPTRRGDVLLTSEAPLGRVALVPDDQPLVLGQRLFGLRGKQGVLDSSFLYYALQTSRVQFDLIGRSTGTTVTGIRQSALRQLEIDAPSFPEQQAIAEVLGALDDKIAANARLAAIIDAALAATFERDFGGSATASLGEIADVNAAKLRPEDGGVLRYLDISSVGVGRIDQLTRMHWAEAPARARRRVSVGDTVWSTVRPNRRSHALILDASGPLVASTGLAVLTPRESGPAFLYEATRRPEFTTYLENVAEGSAYPAVRADKFAAAPVPKAVRRARDAFDDYAMPMRERQHAGEMESLTLAALREALLPELMSGRLRVKEAERAVEEAV